MLVCCVYMHYTCSMIADWRDHISDDKQSKMKKLAMKISDCKTIVNAYYVMYQLFPNVGRERLKMNVDKIVRSGLVVYKETNGYPDFWDAEIKDFERIKSKYPYFGLLVERLELQQI